MNITEIQVNGKTKTIRSQRSPSGGFWLVTVSGWHFRYSTNVSREQAEQMATEQYIAEQS